ncbi:MAG TPA: ABC transporter substrate-binding protein [Desulfobacterales bacterium]|jgi:zinc transport system substrate-binding protein|nr:ABC transporter substrate-binding protein [Desulfobacterales bacterium]
MRRSVLPDSLSLAMFLAILFLKAAQLCPEMSSDATEKTTVFVSILPQAYFVERVGGERVDVSVLVGPGYSPATYEPNPTQMAELSRAKLYFRIGVPFENVWIERMIKANPDMKVVDTRRGIELLPMKTHHHGEQKDHHHHGKILKDPHIWTSLRLAKIQVQNICDALIREDPAHSAYYENNLRAFHSDVDKLDREVTEVLRNLKTRQFIAFHPAWGYFAHDYGLEQIPIEVEGKEPGARALADLIKRAKEEGIKVVFVQAQFSTRNAETVARAIGARIVRIDPLAKDYLTNMMKIAEAFAEGIQ